MFEHQHQKSHYIKNTSLKYKSGRILWEAVYFFFFKPTPRWCFNSWRIFLLKLFGAKIGNGCRVLPSCYVWAPWNLSMGSYSALSSDVDCYSVDRIEIGSRVTISQRTFLCAASHDIKSLALPLTSQPIVIEDHAWICAEVFIGPGVKIGRGSIVSARSVCVKDVMSFKVVGGNPAKVLKDRTLDPSTNNENSDD